MEQRVHAAHKDGDSTSTILEDESQNLNFPPELGCFLDCNEKVV